MKNGTYNVPSPLFATPVKSPPPTQHQPRPRTANTASVARPGSGKKRLLRLSGAGSNRKRCLRYATSSTPQASELLPRREWPRGAARFLAAAQTQQPIRRQTACSGLAKKKGSAENSKVANFRRGNVADLISPPVVRHRRGAFFAPHDPNAGNGGALVVMLNRAT
jgi:hypothetical protein